MACQVIEGIARGCKDNAGGIVEAYIGNYPSGYTAEEWYSEVEGNVTGISGLTIFTFVPNKSSSFWGDNISASSTNIGYEHAVTLLFSKNEASKRNQVKLLGQATLIIIVRDRNGKYFMLGPQAGMELMEGNSSSGTALADTNGWTLTFKGDEPYPALEVSASVVSGLITD